MPGEPSQRIRAFFAVELPGAIRGMINGFAKKLPIENVKWVAAENIHITMRFLGDIDRASVPALVRDVEGELRGFDAFEIHPDGFGVFPPRGKPRTFWVGLKDGREELCELSLRMERALARHGFREENRAFTPHITIGRAREERRPRREYGGEDHRPVLRAPEPRQITQPIGTIVPAAGAGQTAGGGSTPMPGSIATPAPFVVHQHRFVGSPVWVPALTLFESRLPEYGGDRREPEYIPLARIKFNAGIESNAGR